MGPRQPSTPEQRRPQEVVDVLTVPTAVTKVHDMPGLAIEVVGGLRLEAALRSRAFAMPLLSWLRNSTSLSNLVSFVKRR